jgi:hypothetical protein
LSLRWQAPEAAGGAAGPGMAGRCCARRTAWRLPGGVQTRLPWPARPLPAGCAAWPVHLPQRPPLPPTTARAQRRRHHPNAPRPPRAHPSRTADRPRGEAGGGAGHQDQGEGRPARLPRPRIPAGRRHGDCAGAPTGPEGFGSPQAAAARTGLRQATARRPPPSPRAAGARLSEASAWGRRRSRARTPHPALCSLRFAPPRQLPPPPHEARGSPPRPRLASHAACLSPCWTAALLLTMVWTPRHADADPGVLPGRYRDPGREGVPPGGRRPAAASHRHPRRLQAPTGARGRAAGGALGQGRRVDVAGGWGQRRHCWRRRWWYRPRRELLPAGNRGIEPSTPVSLKTSPLRHLCAPRTCRATWMTSSPRAPKLCGCSPASQSQPLRRRSRQRASPWWRTGGGGQQEGARAALGGRAGRVAAKPVLQPAAIHWGPLSHGRQGGMVAYRGRARGRCKARTGDTLLVDREPAAFRQRYGPQGNAATCPPPAPSIAVCRCLLVEHQAAVREARL